jgi:hypothetical protein
MCGFMPCFRLCYTLERVSVRSYAIHEYSELMIDHMFLVLSVAYLRVNILSLVLQIRSSFLGVTLPLS